MDGIVGGGIMALVEGFSKIPSCSTEGRSLMSMDVSAYRSILQKIQSPSSLSQRSQPYRDVQYVDTFIKMFYFPHGDAMAWMEENCGKYHYSHLLALIMATATNAGEAKKSIQKLNVLYGSSAGEKGNDAKMIRL